MSLLEVELMTVLGGVPEIFFYSSKIKEAAGDPTLALRSSARSLVQCPCPAALLLGGDGAGAAQ